MWWDGLARSICCLSWWRSLSGSIAMLFYTGRGFVSLNSLPPQKRDKEKQLDLDCKNNLLWADQGMERLLGASWGKISWPFGCKLLSCLSGDRRGEDVSLSRNGVECLEEKKEAVNFRKTGVREPVIHSSLSCRVDASVSSFSTSAYRTDITELIMTSLWRTKELLKSSIQQQRNVRVISQQI